MYYSVSGKYKPEILDQGSVYKETKNCSNCGKQSKLIRPGAYFPSWSKRIGLFSSIAGIVASDEAIKYLRKNDVTSFHLDNVDVKFAREPEISQKFHLLKPKEVIELDPKQGAGPITVCEECNRKLWGNSMELPFLPSGTDFDFFQIKYTYIFVVNESFKKICENVPDGSFLEFEQWYYKSENSTGAVLE